MLHNAPKDRFNHRTTAVSAYRNRILLMLVASELIALAFFYFWPARSDVIVPSRDFSSEVVTIEQIRITVQSPAAPAPPRPKVPVLAPEYEIVEEDIEIEDIALPELPDFTEEQINGAGTAVGIEDGAPVTNPSKAPSVLKIVEPTLPPAARKIKAELSVRFLVNAAGDVEEVSLSDIYTFDDKMKQTKVQQVGFGVEEAVLEAAYQWKFRPARNLGKEVRAYTQHIFSIGF